MSTLLPNGVHSGVPFSDYCLDPGINASTLKHFAGRTPKHAKLELDKPDEDTTSMTIGHAAHTAVLEPNQYDQIYAVYPKAEFTEKYGRSNSNAHKAARAEWENEHAHAIPLTDAEHEHAQAIRRAVLDHPLARRLLIDNKGKNELTIICDDGKTRRKARIDRLTKIDGWPAVVDLKTINPKGDHLREFVVSRYIHQWSVHMQLAWYMDCLNRHAEADRIPIIVFVENEPPYDVAVYRVGEQSIAQGRSEAELYMQQLIQCRETGYWPGFSLELEGPVELPPYALEQEIMQ